MPTPRPPPPRADPGAVQDIPVKLDASRFFIDRPIFAAVLSIVITVAGLIAIPNLPLSEYPDVVPPIVQVRAVYPGANPTTLSQTVAAPLEEAINGVDDMIYMKSVAASDGVMQLDVVFEIGTDVDKAQVQVQNRVSQALPRLPEAVRQLGVSTTKSAPNLTMVVFLKSTDGRYDQLYLRNYILLNIRDELNRLDGVGQVFLFGGGDYAMRVWLDPEKIAARGIAAGDVVRALREQNVQVSAGSIGAAAAAERLGPADRDQRAGPPEHGRGVLRRRRQDGAAGRADPHPRHRPRRARRSEYALRSLSDNQRAVAIPIFEAPGANSLAMSDDVRATMARAEKDFPPGIAWSVDYDPTVFVRQSIESVVTTLLEAILLVVIVVVLFLQTWRASIIPLLAVPVSIIGTFAVLLVFGFSLNTLTLFGLVLAIGIVVDDAIVVVENVERNIEAGMNAARGRAQGDERGVGPDHRDRLVLTRGVRADRLPRRHHRAVLPPVRGHDRDLDHHLHHQLADAVAGAGGGAAARPRPAEGPAETWIDRPSAGCSGRSTAASSAPDALFGARRTLVAKRRYAVGYA
jgi:multidrug efflux pump subunit AcrB